MANNGLVSGNSQNAADAPVVRTHSKFPLSAHTLGTYRFGENAPCFVMEVVPKDKIPVSSRHTVRSYTMKAPLMQNVDLHKTSFAVPMEAILPFNWDKLYTNPVIGDDVDAELVGTTVSEFQKKIRTFFNNEWIRIRSLSATTMPGFCDKLYASLRLLILMESVYSHGSLAASLGYRLYSAGRMAGYKANKKYYFSFDQYFDAVINNLSNIIGSITIDVTGSGNYVVPFGNTSLLSQTMDNNLAIMTPREFLEILRDDVTAVTIDAASLLGGAQFTDDDFLMLDSYVQANEYGNCNFLDPISDLPNFPVNLARLWAYQLINAHYFSNDHVDYIYSAELYRQNVGSIIDSVGEINSFMYNGIAVYYDYLSAFYFDSMIGNAAIQYAAAYLQLLLSFRHSLRFMDYFVGSRVSPLAIGDVTAQVQNGSVSAIDTTRSIQMQRFLNAVNRAGRKFSNYVQELFGVTPAQDYHNPIYLGDTKDTVYAVETENTGERQWSDPNSVSANFKANSEKFLLEYFADRPAIVMTIMSFDVPRAYTQAMERQLFHRDRFDMFNPFMQFLGDQRVYEAEFKPSMSGSVHELQYTFGYQNRYEEYKQKFHTAFGGFVENLPAWAFLADEYQQDNYTVRHISPSFIRSKVCEFDKFYLSLTGWSLGSYFHFIIDNYNMLEASRPMAYNPNIL